MTVETLSQVHYVSDSDGKPVSVLVPIEIWEEIQREIRSEQETDYLLNSPAMKKRLLDAKERTDGIPLEEVRARLGI